MSTYKDCKPIPWHEFKYFWYLTDKEANEFLHCDNCNAPAPLHRFETYTTSVRWFCEICSQVAPERSCAPTAAVANIVLAMLGKFDDVEVKEYRGDREDEE